MQTGVNSPVVPNPTGSPGPVLGGVLQTPPDQMPIVPVEKIPKVLFKRNQMKSEDDIMMNPLLKNIKDLISMLQGKDEYEQIVDVNLKNFYSLATKEEQEFKQYGLYNVEIAQFFPGFDLSKKFQLFHNLDQVVASPDGSMAAAMTLWGTPVVFNLNAKFGEKRFRILDQIISELPKPGEDGFEDEEVFNTSGEGSKKLAERMEKVKELKMTFSPDSSFLIVSSILETLAYDLRNLFVVPVLPTNKVTLVPMNLKSQTTRGKVLFQYFFKNNFNNLLFTPVDRQILVIAYQKQVKFIVFCTDNFYKSASNFLPPNFVIDFTSRHFTAMFNDDPQKKRSDTLVEVQTNESNHFILHRRTITGKNSIEAYKFDLDTAKKEGRLSAKYTVDLPASTSVFLKTLSPSGNTVFAYQSKMGMIQKLKFKDKSDKFEIEHVFKLTGKRKNIKHLAVKDDGKYLLLVDSNGNAEVLFRAGSNSYISIHTFNAMNDSQLLIKSGLIDKSKGMTEHDVTNMDFLEDGSGILSFFSCVVMIQPLSLGQRLENQCLFNNRPYFYTNLRKRNNGMYSMWQKKGKILYQKIIDFNPATNRGCVVRTFQESGVKSMKDVLIPPEMLYKDFFCTDNSQNKDNFRELKNQLEDFFEGDCYDWDDDGEDYTDTIEAEVKVLNIPNQPVEAYILQKHDLITAYRREDVQAFHQQFWARSFDYELPKIHWSRTVPLPQSDENEVYFMSHLNFYVDSQAVYITVPKSGNDGGIVFDMIQTEIPKGVGMFPLNKNFILVSRESEDVVNDMMTDEEKKTARNSVLMLFDMYNRQFVLDKKIKAGVPHPYVFMAETNTLNIKALIGPNTFCLYNVEEHKIIYEKAIFEGDRDETAANIEYDTHMYLRSPNGKFFFFSSIEDSNKVVYFKLKDNASAATRMVPTISSRVKKDYMNRWCFSHDSKYMLIVVNDQISVFSTDTDQVITKILVDKLATLGKILNIQLRNDSTVLEIVVGYRNQILLRRIPFYPTSRDLMLYDLNKKLDELARTLDIQDRDNLQKDVTDIMTSLPLYQRFLDTTYLKLLCLFDNNHLTSCYFQRESPNKSLIWKSPYSKLVATGDLMFAHSANSFIDLLEDTLNQEGELPPINYDILLGWMKSGKLQITYKRKLMNLLTFKPYKYDLAGELKHEQISMAKIPLDAKGQTDPKWLQLVEKELMVQDSANKQEFDCFRTAIRLDLSNGNYFSLDYFRWMEDMTDEELKTRYSSVIYYKWSRIIKYAIIYSCVFWILNALVCAFMAFAWTQWGLAIPILIINVLFILYELKCFYSMPKMSSKDSWNYYDLIMHVYCIACVLAIRIGGGDGEELSYQYNWLRVTCFGIVSWRGMTMLRIFQATRYLLTMLFQVFGKMVAFLCVFAYIIFIYWFICLVRPALVPEGEDEKFYTSLQQAVNIAFSNFDADLDSVIVFITTVMGQIVLALVMLNFLIAIISKVYDDVAAERELYDVKMLLQLIVEFGCFLNRPSKSETPVEYFIVVPKLRQSNALDDIEVAFEEEKGLLTTEVKGVLTTHSTETKTMIEKATAQHMDPIRKALEALEKRVDEIHTKQAGSKKEAEKNKKQSFEAEIEADIQVYRAELDKEFKSWEKKKVDELEKVKVEVEAELKKEEEEEAAKKKEEEEQKKKKEEEEKAAALLAKQNNLLPPLPGNEPKPVDPTKPSDKKPTDSLPKRAATALLGGKFSLADIRNLNQPRKSIVPQQEAPQEFIGPMLPPEPPAKKENRYQIEVKNFEIQKKERQNLMEEQIELQRAKLEEEYYQDEEKDEDDDDIEYDEEN